MSNGLFFARMGSRKEHVMIDARNSKEKEVTLKKIEKNPVKLTALLYLKEALLNQQYENCREFITIAKEFGAQDFEIQNLLEDARRVPT